MIRRRKPAPEKFSAEHFIRKFSVIPEKEWLVGSLNDYQGRHDVVGWCEVGETEELVRLFGIYLGVDPVEINDARDERYPQLTPKKRILAALEDIQRKKGH